MTKTTKVSLDIKSEMDDDQFIKIQGTRKSSYKNQKPLLEKRRRDRINNSLDELKSLLLAIKQRDPLRYARLEKADILEMVVKHLKDIKKRRQALVAGMEPILFRNFKMGYIDCTKATINFINESENTKKQQIIEHVTKQCMDTFETHIPTAKFNQYFQTSLSGSSNQPFLQLSSLIDNEPEWPTLEDRLGFTSMDQPMYFLPRLDSFTSSMKPTEGFMVREPSNSFDSTLNVSISEDINDNLKSSISMEFDTSDKNDDKKIIIDEPNNNETAWRPWL